MPNMQAAGSARLRPIYSRPWAWFWTFFVGLSSGVGAGVGAHAAGVSLGWSIALGVGSAALFGGGCALSLYDPRSAQPLESAEEPRS